MMLHKLQNAIFLDFSNYFSSEKQGKQQPSLFTFMGSNFVKPQKTISRINTYRQEQLIERSVHFHKAYIV